MVSASKHFHLCASNGMCDDCPWYDGPEDLEEEVCRGFLELGHCALNISIYDVVQDD